MYRYISMHAKVRAAQDCNLPASMCMCMYVHVCIHHRFFKKKAYHFVCCAEITGMAAICPWYIYMHLLKKKNWRKRYEG